MKGKFSDKCTRIHERLANVMVRKMYERFLLEVPRHEFEELQDVMMNIPTDSGAVDEGHFENPIILAHIQKLKFVLKRICTAHLRHSTI